MHLRVAVASVGGPRARSCRVQGSVGSPGSPPLVEESREKGQLSEGKRHEQHVTFPKDAGWWPRCENGGVWMYSEK